MSSIAMSSIAFACVFGGAVAAMLIKRRLPAHHFSTESKEVLKLGMGLIATLAALVLGLLIATAKGTYDSQSNSIKELSAKVLLLEGVLAKYGTETKEARSLLRRAVAATEERLWPQDARQSANLTPGESRAALEGIYDSVAAFAPRDDAQRSLKARALDVTAEVASARIRLFAQRDSPIPMPLLMGLVFWLTVLFIGFGLLAPGNPTVVLMLLVCALSVSGAIFLILELDTPFAGIMRVSSKPLHDALELLGL